MTAMGEKKFAVIPAKKVWPGEFIVWYLQDAKPGWDLSRPVFQYPILPVSCGQEMDNGLENRDDDVKEHIPVKHFFAHLP